MDLISWKMSLYMLLQKRREDYMFYAHWKTWTKKLDEIVFPNSRNFFSSWKPSQKSLQRKITWNVVLFCNILRKRSNKSYVMMRKVYFCTCVFSILHGCMYSPKSYISLDRMHPYKLWFLFCEKMRDSYASPESKYRKYKHPSPFPWVCRTCISISRYSISHL